MNKTSEELGVSRPQPVLGTDWFDAERARAYGRVVAVASLLFAAANVAIFIQSARLDSNGLPLPNDFAAFWAGSRLAVDRQPSLAYDLLAIGAQEHTQTQAASGGRVLPYMYPPIFLLLTLPFALLPYVPALIGFTVAGFASFTALMRRLLPRSWPWLTIVACPGAVVNGLVGQNGFISASCFAAGALLLDTRPLLAGASLGLLAFKPHLALGVPVALACARRWRALAACAGSACLLAFLSWLALGTQTWAAFLHAATITAGVLRAPNVYGSGASLYAATLILGGSFRSAIVVQAVSAVAALTCLTAACLRRPGAHAEFACTVCACLLCTPYLMDYDLVCLTVPLACLATQATRTGWRSWEKLVASAAYLIPFGARTLSMDGAPLTPILLWCLLALTTRRAISR